MPEFDYLMQACLINTFRKAKRPAATNFEPESLSDEILCNISFLYESPCRCGATECISGRWRRSGTIVKCDGRVITERDGGATTANRQELFRTLAVLTARGYLIRDEAQGASAVGITPHRFWLATAS